MNRVVPIDSIQMQATLRRLLEEPLPGRAVQSRFSPSLGYGRHFGPSLFGTKPAAVLVFLYPSEGQWWFPLTLRPTHLPDHAGQISLPGGRVEAGESFEEAAFREFREELGVEVDDNKAIGSLSDLTVYASLHRVVPFLAVSDRRPEFQPNSDEVSELIEVPISKLLHDAEIVEHRTERGALNFASPAWKIGDLKVWGATAMILSEFAELLRRQPEIDLR